MKFSVQESYRQHRDRLKDYKLYSPKVCRAVMKDLIKADPDLFDIVNDMAEETTFTVRKYPDSFYCYPHHKDLKDCSPWPASRYPKASLCVTFAIELQNKD